MYNEKNLEEERYKLTICSKAIDICIDRITTLKKTESLKEDLKDLKHKLVKEKSFSDKKRIVEKIRKYLSKVIIAMERVDYFEKNKLFQSILRDNYESYIDEYVAIINNSDNALVALCDKYLDILRQIDLIKQSIEINKKESENKRKEVERKKLEELNKTSNTFESLRRQENKELIEKLKNITGMKVTTIDYEEILKIIETNYYGTYSKEFLETQLEILKLEKQSNENNRAFKEYSLAELANNVYKNTVEYLMRYENSNYNSNFELFIQIIGADNSLKKYEEAYTKFMKKLESMPEKDRANCIMNFYEILSLDVKKIHIDESRILTPEELKRMINAEIKSQINGSVFSVNRENEEQKLRSMREVTKYMSAEEIVKLYYQLKNKSYIVVQDSSLQYVFAHLIESRMNPIDIEVQDKKKAVIERNTRLVAICEELFHEHVLFNMYGDVAKNIPEDFASKRIESYEAIESQQEKYFRMSKLKRAFNKMKFDKLKRLRKKFVLSDSELEEVKVMF